MPASKEIENKRNSNASNVHQPLSNPSRVRSAVKAIASRQASKSEAVLKMQNAQKKAKEVLQAFRAASFDPKAIYALGKKVFKRFKNKPLQTVLISFAPTLVPCICCTTILLSQLMLTVAAVNAAKDEFVKAVVTSVEYGSCAAVFSNPVQGGSIVVGQELLAVAGLADSPKLVERCIDILGISAIDERLGASQFIRDNFPDFGLTEKRSDIYKGTGTGRPVN